ncbi:hypothetical protein MUO66_04525 [Candidatus Bathyarchaeota archaeon]|nr:hypothetical protein [Candidatus Bathyarchaeota archaeon]
MYQALESLTTRNAKSNKAITQHNTRYYCNECKQAITYAVFKYSIRNFDKSFCRGCQPVIEKTISVPSQKYELNKPAGIEIGGFEGDISTCKGYNSNFYVVSICFFY